jgi:hypothetical protein
MPAQSFADLAGDTRAIDDAVDEPRDREGGTRG